MFLLGDAATIIYATRYKIALRKEIIPVQKVSLTRFRKIVKKIVKKIVNERLFIFFIFCGYRF